jgi:DNA-binding NarL/FixJ family response regulator
MRVAIAEDSVLLREGVAQLLTDAGYRGHCSLRYRRRVAGIAWPRPADAVIVDIRLPPTHTDEGMRAALTIRQQYPDVGVLSLSQYVEVGLAMQLLADSAEGVGYLLKDG